MDLFEAISTRSCYRGEFNDVPVPREILTQVIETGILAPSACNKQSPSFIGIDDPELIAKIAEITPMPACKTAKAMIVCVSDSRPVYGNMLLALTSFGYSSVWLDGALRRDNIAERIGELLGVPLHKRVQILLPIGVPATTAPKAGRLSFEKRASFNSWGDQE